MDFKFICRGTKSIHNFKGKSYYLNGDPVETMNVGGAVVAE